MPAIKDTKVAILVTDGFEQSELESPRAALDLEGALTVIVSPNKANVKGWKDGGWGDSFPVNQHLDSADPREFDALVLPGGVINPDQLRVNEAAVKFVQHFVSEGKVIAAICHGPWTLINADAVDGRKMTSYPSVRRDLENAGARWVDEEVVVDNGIVTSRNPDDLDAFNAKLIEEIREGKHRRAA